MNEINGYKQEILDAVSDGIFVIDRDFNIVFVNKAMLELCRGLTAEDVNNKKCHDLSHGCPMPCPEGCLQEVICPHAEAFQNGRATSVVHTHTMLDGTKKTFHISSFPIRDEKGHVVQLIQILLDITEMQQTKKAMEQTNHELQRIFENAPFSIAYLDRDMRVLRLNPLMEKIAGFKSHEILGRYCYDIWGEHAKDETRKDRERICDACLVKEALKDGVVHRYLRTTGDLFIEVTAIPVKDENGAVIAAIEIGQDITERKEAEESLRKSAEEIHDLYNNAPCGYHSLDGDGAFVRINDTELSWLGYSLDEIIGKKKLSDVITPKSLQIFRENFPKFKDRGWIRDMEMELVRKDGTIMSVLVSATSVKDKDGDFVMSRTTLYDITEYKKTKAALIKSEEFIKNILDIVDEGFIIIDPEYRIVSANKAYCEQVKCTVKNIVGKHCYDVSHHLDRPCFDAGEECAPAHTFKTGEPCVAIHTHYESEGNPVYIETKSYPVKDASGKVTAAIEILNNITEKKKLEDQLRHAQKMEAVGTLAGGIAHDFNNILTAIMGYANIVQMKMQKDDPQRDDVAQIVESAERAAKLTHSLLAFSREQAMNTQPLNLNELILHMERFTARLIGENIEIRTILGEEEMIIMADSGQIEQVMMNLIINARDAMPDGGVLTIRSKVVDTDEEFLKSQSYVKHGRYVLVSMSDTGTGMDEETKRRIFEPFFTTKEMGRGTGLGLALVYGIVKQHNGYILVDSEPGKGTLFRIYFPSIESPVERKQTKKHEHLPGGGETILVAEDDDTLRKLLQTVLTMGGYKTIMAENGDDAVLKFKEKKDVIQLVLLDMLMPKKSGKEAYDEITEIKTGIKAIFISGYTANGFKGMEGLEKDIALLSKPIMPVDLLKRVREVLDEQA